MSLSQTQIIRTLGEYVANFERELIWGVSAGELRHLTGRIGELYAAMVTRGQMALATNQRGYDVVSAEGERISVKTFTSSRGTAHFKVSTFDVVDRIIILALTVNEGELSIEEILDAPAADIRRNARERAGTYEYSYGATGIRTTPNLHALAVAVERTHGEYIVRQYENATMEVLRNGEPVSPVKAVLLEIAHELHVSPLNGNGNPMNTRSLGAAVLATLAPVQLADTLHDEMVP